MIPLPTKFVERMNSDSFWPTNVLESMDSEIPVSIRINSTKQIPEYEMNNSIPWIKNAYYLSQRPVYTLDPLFHAGCYYPQEAGSMVIEHILNSLMISRKSKILDLCAAPGGKSTLLSSWLDDDGFLVCNEIIPSRNSILRENLAKWGSVNVIVTGNQPIHFQRLPAVFDLILVDAPCSGEGMFRKDLDSRKEWSPQNVLMCADRQRHIVKDVWDSLKEGGYLMYSTCTLNQNENEENVKWIRDNLNAEIIEFPIPNSAIQGRKNIGCYFAPGITESEGFFCAVLRKKTPTTKLSKIKPRLKQLKTADIQQLKEYTDLDLLKCIEFKQGISGFNWQHIDLVEKIDSLMNCTKIGVALGTVLPKKIEPHHELALSNLLNEDVPKVELTLSDALRFLKGETFQILTNERGYSLMTYKNQPLGWINNLGNRFNNLYPNEWRIRMNIY